MGWLDPLCLTAPAAHRVSLLSASRISLPNSSMRAWRRGSRRSTHRLLSPVGRPVLGRTCRDHHPCFVVVRTSCPAVARCCSRNTLRRPVAVEAAVDLAIGLGHWVPSWLVAVVGSKGCCSGVASGLWADRLEGRMKGAAVATSVAAGPVRGPWWCWNCPLLGSLADLLQSKETVLGETCRIGKTMPVWVR